MDTVLYLIHIPGRADLGLGTKAPQEEEERLVSRLRTVSDPEEASTLLRLGLPEQRAGNKAPLEAALEVLSRTEAPPVVCLVMVAVKAVFRTADAIERALRVAPQAYGIAFTDVVIVGADDLTEAKVAPAVREFLGDRVRPTDQVTMTFGSGSTQVALSALDAIIEHGAPWTLVATHPTNPARYTVFDPLMGLPIDPLVPLLRRWRYHDLLAKLVEDDLLHVTDSQRRVLEAEAEQWGRSYREPTAQNLRALMAASLIRNDASSGFAVRAYVEARYQELRAADGNVDLDLLAWATRKAGKRHPVLGRLLKTIRQERKDPEVVASKPSRSGEFLLSSVVCRLNELGKKSAHDLRTADEVSLKALREHLGELDKTLSTDGDASGLTPLSLVPGRRVWYVAILPSPNDKGDPIIQHVVAAASDRRRASSVDAPVRSYLGVPRDDLLPLGALIFGTSSRTAEAAKALAVDLRAEDRPTSAATIDDDLPHEQQQQWMECVLNDHLGDDAGAIVVIPTGPKWYVLPLLHAAQRVAAARGVPLYLRQLVNEEENAVDAGLHRMPLRFGTDLATLTAALHALDCGELDTASRLVGAAGSGQPLGRKVMSLAQVMRCDTTVSSEWPAEVTAGLGPNDLARPLIAERIEVWAKLPNLDSDVATQMRAIVGACASIEASTSRDERPTLRKAIFPELYEVRDRLPITHGGAIGADGVASLVHGCSAGRFGTAAELLAGMVKRARDAYPLTTRAQNRKRLYEVLAEVRTELVRLRDAELRRRVPRQRHGTFDRSGTPAA